VTLRRIPILVLTLIALVAAVLVAGPSVSRAPATFSATAGGWMPSAPPPSALTQTWFCPGVPATGADDVGGALLIANQSADRAVGSLLLFNEQSESRRVDVDIDPWSVAEVDIDATLPGQAVGAVVELEGGLAIVEQQAFNPTGDSANACSNTTSDTWFFADGFTVDGSLDQIVLSNPYDQTVVATLEFATREGSRSPSSYSGLTVPARSTRIVDLGAPGAGAQGEPILAVSVRTTRGRLVAGRSQRALGGGRLGTQVTLGSPATRDQWWFSNGNKGAGVQERYSIYNPTDDDVEVDVIMLGTPQAVQVDPIAVPARNVVTFDPATVESLPDGRYSAVFATLAAQSVVVERATTWTVGDQVATSVIAGATPRPCDDYLATTWLVPRAPAEPTPASLVIYNADNEVGQVTISALGAAGPVAVPSLSGLTLPPPDSVLVIDLVDPLVLNRSLIVETTNRVFVERSFPTGRDDLRASSWAVPAG
jgi:Family of unknown function (DUF5719)